MFKRSNNLISKKELIFLYCILWQANRSIDKSLNSNFNGFSKFYRDRFIEIKEAVEIFANDSVTLEALEPPNFYDVFRWIRKWKNYVLKKKRIPLTNFELSFLSDATRKLEIFTQDPKRFDPIQIRTELYWAVSLIEKIYLPKKHWRTAVYIETYLHPDHLKKYSSKKVLEICGF